MSAQLEAKASAFREQLHREASEFVSRYLNQALSEGSPEYLQAMYEVLAQNTGVVDGYAAILGVDRSLRMHTMRCLFRGGKELVLATHSQDCADCDGAKALKEELEQEQ